MKNKSKPQKISLNKNLEGQLIIAPSYPRDNLYEAFKCPTLHSQDFTTYFLNKKYY